MPSWNAGEKITAAKLNTISISDEQTYTPVVANGGSVTWTTITGSYWTLGSQLVFVNVYLVVNAAGSGTTSLTITMPSNVDRTRRQLLTVNCDAIGAGTGASATTAASRGGEVLFFTSGSGAAADRIRVDESVTGGNETNLSGANLLAGGLITIQGFYKPA